MISMSVRVTTPTGVAMGGSSSGARAPAPKSALRRRPMLKLRPKLKLLLSAPSSDAAALPWLFLAADADEAPKLNALLADPCVGASL